MLTTVKLITVLSSFVILGLISLYTQMLPASAQTTPPGGGLPACGTEIDRITIWETGGQAPGQGPRCAPQYPNYQRKRQKTTIYFQNGYKYYCTDWVDTPYCTTSLGMPPCPEHTCTAQ